MKPSLLLLTATLAGMACAPVQASELSGTWTLVAADVVHPDGRRDHDYGPTPAGRLFIDDAGQYSLLICDPTRPRFAGGDRAKGSAEEYRSAALGISMHFGTIDVDPASQGFTLHMEGASFPNQEGSAQTRVYELRDGVLSYRVPPRPNGDVPVSVWKKLP